MSNKNTVADLGTRYKSRANGLFQYGVNTRWNMFANFNFKVMMSNDGSSLFSSDKWIGELIVTKS